MYCELKEAPVSQWWIDPLTWKWHPHYLEKSWRENMVGKDRDKSIMHPALRTHPPPFLHRQEATLMPFVSVMEVTLLTVQILNLESPKLKTWADTTRNTVVFHLWVAHRRRCWVHQAHQEVLVVQFWSLLLVSLHKKNMQRTISAKLLSIWVKLEPLQ